MPSYSRGTDEEGKKLRWRDGLPGKGMRFSARLIFTFGLVFMVAGAAFFLANVTERSQIAFLAAFLSIIIGILLSIFATRLHKRPTYIYFSSFFILFGLFFIVFSSQIIPAPFRQVWPALSILAGFSFIPAGWYAYHKLRLNYLVCCLVFVILGAVLLVFSLDVIDISFRAFFLEWWPLLILFFGLLLILSAASSKRE